jgi:hypothetical protein
MPQSNKVKLDTPIPSRPNAPLFSQTRENAEVQDIQAQEDIRTQGGFQTKENTRALDNTINNPRLQDEQIEVNGKSLISNYIGDVPAKPETIKVVHDWFEHQRESTRSRVSILLVKFFGGSLAGTFLMLLIAVFQPTAAQTAIKEYIPLILTPQVTLLGVALGFYFGNKED